jgi:hypothetical protein
VAVAGELTTHEAAQGGVVGEEAGAVHAPHEFLLVSDIENWTLVSDVCFLWKVKSAPSSAARARRAPCLVVSEWGVCLFGDVCVCIGFEVAVCAGFGFP